MGSSRKAKAGGTAKKKDLSPGQRVAIGLAVIALGIGVVALGVDSLANKVDKLAAGEFGALPVGVTFALGGALLALPQGFVRSRALIAALMITALALTADWVAFGPGESSLASGFSLSTVRGPLQTGHMLSRVLFGIAAVLADLLALWAWVRFFVSLGGAAANRARSS
jgi:hypothetical protein